MGELARPARQTPAKPDVRRRQSAPPGPLKPADEARHRTARKAANGVKRSRIYTIAKIVSRGLFAAEAAGRGQLEFRATVLFINAATELETRFRVSVGRVQYRPAMVYPPSAKR
jgi:hypothetical protein